MKCTSNNLGVHGGGSPLSLASDVDQFCIIETSLA